MSSIIEDRLRAIEDKLEIMKLMAIYGDSFDKGWNDKAIDAKQLLELFTEDALWECEFMSISFKGRDELADLPGIFDDFSEFYQHSFSNPIINIDGDKARGKWRLLLGSSSGPKINLTFGSYENDYVRTAVGWRIQAIRLHVSKVLEP